MRHELSSWMLRLMSAYHDTIAQWLKLAVNAVDRVRHQEPIIMIPAFDYG